MSKEEILLAHLWENDVDAVRRDLNGGADVNSPVVEALKRRMMPLDIAAMRRCPKMLNLLLDNCARVSLAWSAQGLEYYSS